MDFDVLFVNGVAFLLAKSKDIEFIHCKIILTKSDKRVMNRLKLILLDYEAIGFEITTAFTESAFKPIINWMRQELHVDLSTCAADLHLPIAENMIRFVKERVRCIQSESPFTRYLKRLTIKMVKRVTIFISLLNKKSGVHSVMSHRQILLGIKFKAPLCKVGKLEMAYNMTRNNKTARQMGFFALYIGPRDSNTFHIVHELSTKNVVTTSRC